MRTLNALFVLLTLCFATASAQFQGATNPFKTKARVAQSAATPHTLATPQAAMDVNLSYVPFAYYTPSNSTDEAANYYFEVSSVSASLDDDKNIVFSAEGWALNLDLYAAPSASPYAFAEGTYTAYTATSDDDVVPAMSYTSDYSFASYYAKAGTDRTDYALTGDVVVTKSNDTYTIKATTVRNGQTYNLTFTGKISFESTVSEGSSLPQIGHDIIVDFTGGCAFYQGNLFQANTGNMEINLYTTTFDASTGATTAPGYVIKMSLFNTLFGNPESARVKAGVYTPSYKFAKNTFLPGTDVTYAGMTMILGSYGQYRDESGNLRYTNITSGTCEVIENEDGTFTVNVDALTKDGYVVRGSYTGTLPVTDVSDDTPTSHLSTLTEDHELDLAKIEKARLWRIENVTDASHDAWAQYVVDIGSRSGLDQVIVDQGGDIFRMQFVGNAQGGDMMPEGSYDVIANRWSTSYKTMCLVPGYTYDGDLVGTVYIHFTEGRYLIMDGYAPAAEGTISVMHNDDDTYTFVIDLFDDAGYRLTGKWTGPVECQTTGIESAQTDAEAAYTFIDYDTILVPSAAKSGVQIYAANGQLVRTVQGTNRISLSGLPSGVYVVRTSANQTIKLAR